MVTLVAGELSAQCAGYATAATTSTQHFNCSDPKGALQWTLNVACVDGCGKVWWTLSPQNGSADGACDFLVRNFCSPEWYRYSYTNGMYAESSSWPAKLFGGCTLDKTNPVITDGNCPCAPDCGVEPVPPPGQCSESPEVTSSTLGLGETRSADLRELPSGFFSERREVVDGVRFIMEDWAVARVEARDSGAVRLLRVAASSSPLLGPKPSVLSMRPAALASENAEVIALVIEMPVHPENSRMIPTPVVELRPAALAYLGDRITAAVRIDVGEDRRIRDTQILYSSGLLPVGIDLAQHLESILQLRYGSEKGHRVIIYGIVEIDAGAARLRESEVVLPLCCCNPRCI
ncbi:MAG TPA: hypothetical protein VLF66_16745 [Thermoanaerobaculia bacterium]|nr:hypothetical protein [Thermoanaerobaculia bacterium]